MRIAATIASTLLAVSISMTFTSAQVVLDGTLGLAGPLIGPEVIVPAAAGTTAGGNLFHSFSRLDIPAGESVTFTGPGTVQNVLARVTGGTPSTINGILRCDIPDADLYLINPAGVVFGSGSALEVRGSFAVTSADFIRLGESGRFDAKSPGQSVLVSAAPSAFGFAGAATPGAILVQGNLGVGDGRSVSVVGGNVQIVGGEILAGAGTVNLVSARAGDHVSTGTPTITVVDPPGNAVAPRGAVEIRDGAVIDTGGAAVGRVNVRGGALRVEGAVVNSVVTGSVGEADAVAIDVSVDGAVTIGPGGSVFSGTVGAAESGDIVFVAASVAVESDGSDQFTGIGSQSAGAGAGGDIHITADTLHLANRGGVFAFATGTGTGGDIRLRVAQRADLSDGGQVVAQARGIGAGGDVTSDAGSLILAGARASITSDTIAAGAGGNVAIRAADLRIADTAFISATTNGTGSAGDIQIEVTGEIELDGAGKLEFTGIGSNTQADDLAGRGGSVRIAAKTMRIVKGAGVAAKTFAGVEGGNIDLLINRELLIRGQSESNLTGLNAQALGTGAGGNVTVDAQRVILDKGQINADAQRGRGGNIALRGDPLILSADSLVNASSQLGIDGSVLIEGQETDFITSLVRLPGALGTGARLEAQCGATLIGEVSSFVVTGRGGAPIAPDGFTPDFAPATR